MLTVADLRRAAKSDDIELAAARSEHDRAWKAHNWASIHAPSFVAVREANERIGRALRRLMGAE